LHAQLIVTLRDILCANLSLDDGLSAVQNIPFNDTDESNILFDIARSIEEIILRRPGLASAKLTELTMRLSLLQERTIPEMLMLLDTRYTNSHRRSECEICPDIEAIPNLVDILGELSQALSSAIRLNLRPLLPFLADEVLMTLNAIFDRRHDGTIHLASYEVRNLGWALIEVGFYEGAELLLNRLIEISNETSMNDFSFEVTFDYACVLTELGLYEESRNFLKSLKKIARGNGDQERLAIVNLQLGVNDIRDDSVAHEVARETGDKAAEMYDLAYKSGVVSVDDLSLAHVTLGSSILVNGWREGIPHALERLKLGLRINERLVNKTSEQQAFTFRTLAGLGFAHGLLGDHENMTKCLKYLNKAKDILQELDGLHPEIDSELARTENAIGWLCLSTECDEFWPHGVEAFKRAVTLREVQFKEGRVSELELLGAQMGFALSHLRIDERSNEDTQDRLRQILAQYITLFPTDSRAFVEIAIATYDVVWLIARHDWKISPRLLRLLDDVDRMLEDAIVENDSLFIDGVAIVVPYLGQSWPVLLKRSKRMSQSDSQLAGVAGLCTAFSIAKINLDALNLEVGGRVQPPVDDAVLNTDTLLAHYWLGQTYLVQTTKAFYNNKDYSELATGFYGAAIAFGDVVTTESEFLESAEFIKATSASLSQVLRRFALALENQYAAYIDRSRFQGTPTVFDESQYIYLLTEDWLGLIKIANAYLQMVEQSEMVEAQPYLNAVFSNVTRFLRMMDSISLVDRRVLSLLGAAMNRRFYLRK
jgi:tetratricopeptide (TPR) repeat protein